MRENDFHEFTIVHGERYQLQSAFGLPRPGDGEAQKHKHLRIRLEFQTRDTGSSGTLPISPSEQDVSYVEENVEAVLDRMLPMNPEQHDFRQQLLGFVQFIGDDRQFDTVQKRVEQVSRISGFARDLKRRFSIRARCFNPIMPYFPIC